MQLQLIQFLEALDLNALEQTTIPLTKEYDLTLKLVSRNESLPQTSGCWQDLVARNIVTLLNIALKHDLPTIDLTSCFPHHGIGYRLDAVLTKAQPKIESTPTEPAVSTPPRPRIVPNLPNPVSNSLPNTSGVSRHQGQRDFR